MPPKKRKVSGKNESARMIHFKSKLGSGTKASLGILTHGKRFIEGFKPVFLKGKKTYLIDLRKSYFETPLSVGVIFNRRFGRNRVDEERAFEARLRFTKNSVVVVAFQGVRKNISEIRNFEKITKEPIANTVIKEIEKQAKRNGYKEIKIQGPEKLEAYTYPNIYSSLRYRGKTLFEKRHFDGLTAAEEKEFQKILKKETEKIRSRMRKLYGDVATNLGYVKRNGFFIKRLV